MTIVNAGEELSWSVTGINNTASFASQGVEEVTVSFYVENMLCDTGKPIKVSYTFPLK